MSPVFNRVTDRNTCTLTFRPIGNVEFPVHQLQEAYCGRKLENLQINHTVRFQTQLWFWPCFVLESQNLGAVW